MATPLSWKECNTQAVKCLATEDLLKSITPNSFKFSSDGSKVYFLGANPNRCQEQTLLQVDKRGQPKPLLPDELLGGQVDKEMSKEEELMRERRRMRADGITSYNLHAATNTLLFSCNDELWWFRPDEGGMSRPIAVNRDASANQTGPCMDPQFCPSDPDLISFVRDGSVWVTRVSTNVSTEIVPNPGQGIKVGAPSYIIQEEFDRFSGYWWREHDNTTAGLKTHGILYEQVDETNIDLTPVVDYTKPGTVDNFACPLVGSVNAKVSLKFVEFDTCIGTPKWKGSACTSVIKELATPLAESYEWHEYIVRCGWLPNLDTCWVQLLDRKQERMSLVLLPSSAFVVKGETAPANSNSTLVLTTTSTTWVNVTSIIEFFPIFDNTLRFLHCSEDTQYRHVQLVACDLSASPVKSQTFDITQGEWAVDNDRVVVNQNKNEIFFSGRLDTPLEKQLYKVSVPRLSDWIHGNIPIEELTRSNPTRVTEKGFYHDASVSPQGNFIVDVKSSISEPPIAQVFFGDIGAAIFEHPSVDEYIVPELFEFESRHGHTVYGRIYHAQAPQRHGVSVPTVLYVYGGPHVQLVLNKYEGKNLKHSLWCKLGYNVVTFDGRGSSMRGLQFEGAMKHNMGSFEIADQVEGLEYISKIARHKVSLDRVGIYGHSYGGYLALMGIAQQPKIFKVAMAAAPVTYWEAYDTGYTERYMGTPKSNPEAYAKGSVVKLAKQFPDTLNRVFIFHGLQDENVHFHNTAKLIDALITVGKPYNLQVFPKDRHGLRIKLSAEHYLTSLISIMENHL